MFSLKTITFDQIKTSSIALEFDELIPDEIYSWTEADFAKYQVPIGNSRFPITDFFDITVEGEAEGPEEVKMILNGDLNRVKYIGCNAFYRCNNLRTIYYLGYLKDLKIEGFSGDYGSVNPIWLCKADIPSWQPKVNFSISEDANNKCVLKVSIGGVAFNLIRVTKTRTSSFFIGETAVTRALWKIIMNDYPDGQNNDRCPIRITYLETGTFISKLNEITQMRFSLPSPFIWLEAAEGNKRRIDYSNIKIIPRDQEYEVKSVRTNDLGLYDMFGPGELCDKEELIGSSIIPSHYAPLMGYEILDKVDDRIGIADPQNERYAFRLYLSCENTLLDKYRIY